jgi:DNA-binding NarL/FixJ family response regulator
MSMKSTNSKGTDLAGRRSGFDTDSTRRATILIVNGHPKLRHGLVQLIHQQSELGVCIEADNAGQALKTIEKRRIDLAIVDICETGPVNTRLAEKIKLRCPNLPLLSLSINDDQLRSAHDPTARDEGFIVGPEAGEKIIAAIRYVKSLLRNRLYGFTVLVKI